MKTCFECGQPAEYDHHVIPKSKGGTMTVPLCGKCHSIVHDVDMVTMRSLAQQKLKANRKNRVKVEQYARDAAKLEVQKEMRELRQESLYQIIAELKKHGFNLPLPEDDDHVFQTEREMMSRMYK